MTLFAFLRSGEEKVLIAAIQNAESQTSGEIRVHIEVGQSSADTFQRALEIFAKLEMYKTQKRNGVLFYVAVGSRSFAIVADEGINRIVPENFWEDMKDQMKVHFKKHHYLEGLLQGITQTGDYLKKYFPSSENDTNELENSVST